ncbi:MAG: pyridoxamine 5'-phosphate oxidase family protein [Planctomycetaceae bacterium]|nr:pyridoxamine 5'-phosphate oxidase family protein [Planctomycetaceae bacterium]
MNQRPASDIAFTTSVKQIQTEKGSRETYARMAKLADWKTRVDGQLRDFLQSLDMFYLGTANASGQPYIQYRGGPAGFLKVLDDHTLAFADFGGNRQYITLGNLAENPRAFLFLMDYENRRRIKVWGTAEVINNDPDLLAGLHEPEYPAPPERVIVFRIEAWDVNCPQHIHPRVKVADVTPELERLRSRIAELEQQLADR